MMMIIIGDVYYFIRVKLKEPNMKSRVLNQIILLLNLA